MIRRKRYTTETCWTCRRPGWRHENPYTLWTEDEWKRLFQDHTEFQFEPKLRAKYLDYEALSVHGGMVSVWDCCREGADLASELGRTVVFSFNQHDVIIRPGDDPELVGRDWWFRAYGKTPEESAKER